MLGPLHCLAFQSSLIKLELELGLWRKGRASSIENLSPFSTSTRTGPDCLPTSAWEMISTATRLTLGESGQSFWRRLTELSVKVRPRTVAGCDGIVAARRGRNPSVMNPSSGQALGAGTLVVVSESMIVMADEPAVPHQHHVLDGAQALDT